MLKQRSRIQLLKGSPFRSNYINSLVSLQEVLSYFVVDGGRFVVGQVSFSIYFLRSPPSYFYASPEREEVALYFIIHQTFSSVMIELHSAHYALLKMFVSEPCT